MYSQYGYILDPHSAVGMAALFRERERSSDHNIDIILATAHPAKFSKVVEETLGVTPAMPPQLMQSLDKTEKSTPLSTRYEELKEFLER